MQKQHTAHLNRIRKQFDSLVTKKYKDGQKRHGGYLPHNKHLLDEAINEAIDQVVYLLTLKEQNESSPK